jgi:hypothetical protein
MMSAAAWPDLEIAQHAVELRVPEAADAIFVDVDVVGHLFKFADNGGRPTVLLQHAATADRERRP